MLRAIYVGAQSQEPNSSAHNPSCATVSNLQNDIPLEYEIIRKVFLEPAQLRGQENSTDHRATPNRSQDLRYLPV